MNLPRWYPDLTELADGRFVAISGNSSSAGTWADTPEVYDPANNTWTLISGVSTSQVHEEEYPFSYLLPNGKVFTMGPSEDLSFLLDADAKTWTPVGSSGVRQRILDHVPAREGPLQRRGAERHLDDDGVRTDRGHRPHRAHACVAPDLPHEDGARLPHAHHARGRARPRCRRRGDERPEQRHHR